MARRQSNFDGYRGMLRLFLLALLLALVIWWAVTVSGGPRRSLAKPEPRKPEKRPRHNRNNVRFDPSRTFVGELVLVELEEEEDSATTDLDDDYWPDIIDA